MRGEAGMNLPYSYQIMNQKKKIIKLCKENKCFTIQLKQKRALFVLTRLLDKYPEFLNIHDMDEYYHDPNKAYSELKIGDGFGGFIEENTGQNRVTMAKINLNELFEFFETNFSDTEDVIHNPLSSDRNSISMNRQDKIYEDFHGRCNITGYTLYRQKPTDSLFMKSSLTPSFDHRRPIFKGGADIDENLQLISELANREKNKICLICEDVDCEHCALAYPEHNSIIKGNGQDISEIIDKIKKEDS